MKQATSNKVKPSQKEVVLALMLSGTSEVKKSKNRKGELVDSKYLKFICPNENCKQVVSVKEKMGFTNPYKHLVGCYDGEAKLLKLFDDARKRIVLKGQGDLADYFRTAAGLTQENEAMHDYIRLIVMKNLPITTVEDEFYRSFSKWPFEFGVKRVRRVMFALTEIVENKIGDEMVKARFGAIMHDGWTKGGVHYIGIFSCYLVRDDIGRLTPQITLLAVSPMGKVRDENEVTDPELTKEQETVKFDADAHRNFFGETMKWYKVNAKKWIRASIADNTTTNLKIARDMGIPHVGCNSHKLNLDVERFVRNDSELSALIEKTHTLMTSAKRKLKNAALLRNETDLKPVLHNKTRWSGKYHM